LYRNFPYNFDEEEWFKINPVRFKYGIDGVDAIKRGKAHLNATDVFLKKGFLH